MSYFFFTFVLLIQNIITMYENDLCDFVEDEYYDDYDDRAYDYPTYHEVNHHLPSHLEDTDV